jgi:hypothetical protein
MVAMIATLKTDDAVPSATSLDHVNLDHVIDRKVSQYRRGQHRQAMSIHHRKRPLSMPFSGVMQTWKIVPTCRLAGTLLSTIKRA